MARRKLPTKYAEAIAWIAANDDTNWLHDGPQDPPAASVTLHLVADLWNVPIEEATNHLRYVLDQAAGLVPNTNGPQVGRSE